MIADPRAVAARWPDDRLRMLAELATAVNDAPWTLSAAHRDRARRAGLSDDDVLHAIALAAYFGHLNRVADAVGVALDYDVRHVPPHAEPATPALERAPAPRLGPPALDLERRAPTAAALAAWRAYLEERDPANHAVARQVAGLVGEAEPDGPADTPVRRLVEAVALAPWKLGDAAFAELRALGWDDAALFGVCSAASSFGMFSRIRVALTALGA